MPILTEALAYHGQIRPDRPEPAIEMRLLSERLVFRNMAEFRQAMRHRYVLAHCAGLTVPAILLLYGLDSTGLPIDLHFPSVVVALVAAQVLVVLYLRLATRLARAMCKNPNLLRIWVTPGLAVGAAGMMGVAHLMHHAMGGTQDWTQLRSHILPFFCVLYLEVAATILFRGPVPRALAKLRAGEEIVVADAQETEPKAAQTPAPSAEPVLQDGRGLLRQIPVPGLVLADILRLEASGNYVTVVTRKGRHLVPGPFAAAVAQMPRDLGRQVQRSHWVSLAAVEGIRRQGRELWLQVVCGAQVPVSTAMRSAVQAWLDANDKLVPVTRAVGTRAIPQTGLADATETGRNGSERVE